MKPANNQFHLDKFSGVQGGEHIPPKMFAPPQRIICNVDNAKNVVMALQERG